MTVHDFDPFSRATIEDPYPFYRALRDEAPLFRPKGADCHYVSRYEDIRAIAMDPDRFSSNIVAILLAGGKGRLSTFVPPSLPIAPPDVLAIQDPPIHRTQRKIATAGLGQGFVQGLEPIVRDLTDSLLDDVLSRPDPDWMERFAFRLPMTLTLDILSLPRADADRAKVWADRAIALLSGVNTRRQLAGHLVSGFSFFAYCKREVRAARGRPVGRFMRTLLDAVDDGSMRESEAASVVLQLIIAASDSSASLMGSAVAMLAQDLDLQDRLRAEPALVPAFVEEALRLETPFQGHFRQTKTQVELHGQTLPAGTRVMLLWASGNRDERQYEDPERVDLERKGLRTHYGFGHGIHLCLGAPIARMEGRIALESLLARTERFTLGSGPLRHRKSVFVRTLEHLPLRVTPRAHGRPSLKSASSPRA